MATLSITGSEPGEPGAQAWSVGVRTTGGRIVGATTAGTIGEEASAGGPGLRNEGFEFTELTSGDGNAGAVSSVILSFTAPVELPGEGSFDVLRLDMEASVPPAGCGSVRLEFVDGLRGSGIPVSNKVVVSGAAVLPRLYDATTSVCAPPRIVVEPEELAFGEVVAGGSRSLSVAIRNPGGSELVIEDIALAPGSSADFALSGGLPLGGIAPDAEAALTVRYAPVDAGADAGSVAISSNDPETPVFLLPLTGSGAPRPAPEIDVTPIVIDFGEVSVGSERRASTSVENIGAAALMVTDVFLANGTDSSFELAGKAGAVELAPGARIDVEVILTPRAEIELTGALRILSDDADEPVVTVRLAGRGIPAPAPEIEVVPAALEFGSVQVGGSRRRSVAITNRGDAPLAVGAVALGPGSDASFSVVSSPASFEVAPGGSRDVEVVFAPQETGGQSGTLRIASDDADEPTVVVSVAGSGSPRPAPEIDVSPPSLDFGDVEVGRVLRLEVEMRNEGTRTLVISAVVLGDGTHPSFTITGGPTAVRLAPGALAPVEVSYSPASEGVHTGTLRIRSDDADEAEVVIALSGAGEPRPVPRTDISPLSLRFGDVEVGEEKVLEFAVANRGSADLRVDGVDFDPGTSASFALRPAFPPQVLGPDESRSIAVVFAPGSVAGFTGSIRVSSNDPSAPELRVSLTGRGIRVPNPDIDVDFAHLDFEGVFVGASRVLAVRISNTGKGELGVTGVDLVPGTSPAFTIASAPLSAVLSAGGSIVVEIAFRPAAAGAESGTLRIASDDPDEAAVEVSLLGTGVVLGPGSFRRGDVIIDAAVNLSDGVKILRYLFWRGEPDLPCFDAADANDDGEINISDSIFIFGRLFRSGPEFPDPGPDRCGPDPTADDLPPCDYEIDVCSTP